MPSAKTRVDDFSDTMLPDGIEKIPKRFAIPWRNKWMIDRADYVLTYVTRPFGGAAQFSALAKSKGKIIYEIPFTRYFYKYEAPKPSAEIMQEILAIEAELDGTLAEVFAE